MKEKQFINVINDIQIKNDVIEKLQRKLLLIDKSNHRRRISRKLIIVCVVMTAFLFIVPVLYVKMIKSSPIKSDMDLSAYLETQEIVFNELDQEPIDQSFMDLIVSNDFIPMSKKKLLDYYDVSISIEDVLPKLKEWDTGGTQGIYRNKTRGIYFDNNDFTYQSDDEQQKLTIVLSKGNLPYSGLTSIIEGYDSKLKPSEINGTKMMIAHYKDIEETDKYYAKFMYNGNGYGVYAINLSWDDFLKAIGCLVIK